MDEAWQLAASSGLVSDSTVERRCRPARQPGRGPAILSTDADSRDVQGQPRRRTVPQAETCRAPWSSDHRGLAPDVLEVAVACAQSGEPRLTVGLAGAGFGAEHRDQGGP